MERECPRHGVQKHFSRKGTPYFRCQKCSNEAVSKRRRKIKATLVAEHGGACQLCGYDRCLGSLDFHHKDPSQKSFGIAAKGFTRSLAKSRAEASKCVLLCRNCHGEVEAGLAQIRVSNPGECGTLLTCIEAGSSPAPGVSC